MALVPLPNSSSVPAPRSGYFGFTGHAANEGPPSEGGAPGSGAVIVGAGETCADGSKPVLKYIVVNGTAVNRWVCPDGSTQVPQQQGQPPTPTPTSPEEAPSGGGGPWTPTPGPSGGGGGGAPRPSIPPFSIPANFDNGIGALLGSNIADMLKTPQTRFTPEVISGIKSATKNALEGQTDETLRNLDYDLINRNQFQSPEAVRRRSQIRENQAQSYGSAVNKLMIDKASADFQDRLAGLDRAQQYLDSARQWVLGLSGAETNRLSLTSQVALGYENVALQRAQLEQQWRQFMAQLGLANEQFDFYQWLNTVNLPGGSIPLPQAANLGY